MIPQVCTSRNAVRSYIAFASDGHEVRAWARRWTLSACERTLRLEGRIVFEPLAGPENGCVCPGHPICADCQRTQHRLRRVWTRLCLGACSHLDVPRRA